MPERLSEEVKRAVVERANHCCEYCRTPSRYCPDPLSIEHIVPRLRGGTSELHNRVNPSHDRRWTEQTPGVFRFLAFAARSRGA